MDSSEPAIVYDLEDSVARVRLDRVLASRAHRRARHELAPSPSDWYQPGARPLVELAANRRVRGVSRRPRRPLGPGRAAARRGVPLRTGACGERVETLPGGGEGAGLRRSLLVAR